VFPTVDSVSSWAYDLGHIRPDIIVITTGEVTSIASSADRDLSSFSLFQDRLDPFRRVRFISQVEKLLAYLHAKCISGTALDAGKTVAAAVFLRVSQYSRILFGAEVAIIDAGFDAGATVDTEIVSQDPIGGQYGVA